MLFIILSVVTTFLVGLATPFAITLVANMFQTMIAYELSRHNNTNDDSKFLEDMHNFGINYSLVGLVMFIGGYIGTAFINVAAINQVYYEVTKLIIV